MSAKVHAGGRFQPVPNLDRLADSLAALALDWYQRHAAATSSGNGKTAVDQTAAAGTRVGGERDAGAQSATT